MTSFARHLEQEIFKKKCVGFRRMLNTKTKDKKTIENYVLADAALEHMDKAVKYLVKQIHSNKLDACMILETNQFVVLPKMIHYMDPNSTNKHCDKALQKLMLERIFPLLK